MFLSKKQSEGYQKPSPIREDLMNNFTQKVYEGTQKLIKNIKSVIYIQTIKLEYIIASLIAGGHVILADAHGVGKTSLARALAGSIQWETDDMLAGRVVDETHEYFNDTEAYSGYKEKSYGDSGSHQEDEYLNINEKHPDHKNQRETIYDREKLLSKTGQIGEYTSVRVKPFSRIQCTVDLLPQDILGYNRFAGNTNRMIFNKGPIFAHFILCDEINLLTPKTQGSFLEVMQEQAVTIEGHTYRLPDPFFIIATMNLKGAHLFPLPAPQLDRFMLQLSLGYPDPEDEAGIIKKHGRDDAWDGFKPVISSRELILWQSFVDKVEIHKDVIDYIVALIRQTRYHPDVHTGASPRAGVKLSRFAKALSLVRGEQFVSIDTVKEVFIPVVAHRLIMKDPSIKPESVLREILKTVPVDLKHKVPKSR